MCQHPAGALTALPSSQHVAELLSKRSFPTQRRSQQCQAGTDSSWSCKQAGVGLDSGVHAHVEGMSKGTGCTSEKCLQGERLENVCFPHPAPQMEPVQVGAWEGLKIPQTQHQEWLVSRVEVGEKYPPLLTNVSVSCLCLNIGKRRLGWPPVLLLLYG